MERRKRSRWKEEKKEPERDGEGKKEEEGSFAMQVNADQGWEALWAVLPVTDF